MVLNELGSRIGEALAKMSSAPVVDEAVLDECLKAICTALLQVTPHTDGLTTAVLKMHWASILGC